MNRPTSTSASTSASTSRSDSSDGASANRYARARDLQLRDAFQIFLRQTPPRMLIAGVALTFGVRMWVGSLCAWDLLPVALLLAAHPIAEWLIHVFILHLRPRQIAGRTFDLNAAKHHRAHHVDPWDLRFVVMPKSAIFVGVLIALPATWLVCPTLPLMASTLLALSCIALTYEWAHFLTHTSYRPRGRVYKRIYKFHRLHHFKNEAYWMGVSRHFGDTLFGTMKDPREVPTSPTARDLLARPPAAPKGN